MPDELRPDNDYALLAIEALVALIQDPLTPVMVKQKAAKDILDFTKQKPSTKVETKTSFEDWAKSLDD